MLSQRILVAIADTCQASKTFYAVQEAMLRYRYHIVIINAETVKS